MAMGAREDLLPLGEALSSRFSLGVTVLTSLVPGAGKTFVAQCKASAAGAKRVHVPLHRTVDTSTLLKRHGKELAARSGKPVLLHLDIMDTVSAAASGAGQQLESLLQEMPWLAESV
eukprot:630731-Amphidinium_carterae.1